MKDIIYEDYTAYKKNSLKKHSLVKFFLNEDLKEPILDIGCGDCFLMNVLSQKDIKGFDPSKKAIKLCGNLNAEVSRIKDFKPERQYNTFLLIGVLPFLENPKRDLRTILGWMNNKSILYVTMWNKNSLRNLLGLKKIASEGWKPSHNEFKEFLNKEGFDIIRIIGSGKLKHFPRLSNSPIYVVRKRFE